MDKLINVLVFPAGEINSVELHDALSTCVNIKLYGGSSVDRHGPYVFKNYISGIPFIDDMAFFQKFNQILGEYSIDIVFPTHDTVVTFLVDNQEKINAKIIAGDKKTSEICRNKEKIYELFADHSFIPRLYKDQTDDIPLPVFAKPKIGQGSVGAKKISTNEELHGVSFAEYVVTEYLPGEEQTVDCLTDKNGALKVVSPRSRDRVLAGVSVRGQNQTLTEEIQGIAETINKYLSFAGLWFFQIKKDENGQFKLLEVSTRCAGAMCLTRARGVNLPLLSVYVSLGYDIEPIMNPYNVIMDRTLISRYNIDYEYENVYLDFDDTVIVNDKVHLYTLMFIYQCRNVGKNIYLLTKHSHEIYATLRDYCIDSKLFTEIIQLKADNHKLSKINPHRAIFIDNAFQERKLVHDKFNIPVFDVDTIEVLLDWRT